MSNPTDDILDDILRQKPRGPGYLPRLAEGYHANVVLLRYQPKPSQMGHGTILESDFVVGESLVHQPGDQHGWPWYPSGQGFAGQMEQERAQQFLQTIFESLQADLAKAPYMGPLPAQYAAFSANYPNGCAIHPTTGAVFLTKARSATEFPMPKPAHDVATVGALAFEGHFRGVQLTCTVSKQIDKKTGQQRVNKKFRPICDSYWNPIAQTMAQVQAMRVELDNAYGPLKEAPVITPQQVNHVPPTAMGGQVNASPVVSPPLPPPIAASPPPPAVSAAPKGFLANLRKGG